MFRIIAEYLNNLQLEHFVAEHVSFSHDPNELIQSNYLGLFESELRAQKGTGLQIWRKKGHSIGASRKKINELCPNFIQKYHDLPNFYFCRDLIPESWIRYMVKHKHRTIYYLDEWK